MNADHPLVIFSHGNSFPAGTYRVMLGELRRRGWRVKAVDRFGHDPRYPVTANWPHLVQQLADFAAAEQARSGRPALLVGHSLGGFLSVMAAARHPELACGVLMIDSPLLGGWRAASVRVARGTPIMETVLQSAVSRRRRNRWPGVDEAIEHLRHKKAFASWDPQVLRDYVERGMHEENGQRVLSFDREVESAIYDTIPVNLESLLRRHPLKCPAAFIGGLQSVELKRVGTALTEKITRGRMTMVDGSHLFPMERPIATAATIDASLLNLLDAAQPQARG